MKISFLSVIALLLALGCEPKSEVVAPKTSSSEAKALTDAAATGDAKAKEAIDKYRASK